MTEWNSLFQHYQSPPYVLPHTNGAYSFGIAGQRAIHFFPLSCIAQFIFRYLIGSRVSHESHWTLLSPGPGTGVPFHWHGPGFAEVIYGKKVKDEWSIFHLHHTNTAQSVASLKDLLLFTQRWFFYPPRQEPHFDRNRTTLSWVTEVYPNLPEEEAPLECIIRPGEVTTLVFYQKP